MPVEIKELIIRAVVAPGKEESEESSRKPLQPEEREAVIQEIVQQVMKILQKKKDR